VGVGLSCQAEEQQEYDSLALDRDRWRAGALGLKLHCTGSMALCDFASNTGLFPASSRVVKGVLREHGRGHLFWERRENVVSQCGACPPELPSRSPRCTARAICAQPGSEPGLLDSLQLVLSALRAHAQCAT